jgi:hypothetical protein
MGKPPRSQSKGSRKGNAGSKKHYGGFQIAYWVVLTGLIVSASLAVYYWVIYAQWAGSLEALSGEGDDLWAGLFGPIVWSAGLGGLIAYPVMWTVVAVICLIVALVLHRKIK